MPPEPSDRLAFPAEPDHEACVEMFHRVERGSLDSETVADVAATPYQPDVGHLGVAPEAGHEIRSVAALRKSGGCGES